MTSTTDTICATATASGTGALGIIRVSGTNAIPIVATVFKGIDLTSVASHTVHYGFIINKENQESIDEVMVSVFKAPKTFTAEDLVEISCHGSPYIQQEITSLLCENGARLAQAGEFTQRAFLNGRIDLTQAEAVSDLIAAESKASHELALSQLRGGFSSDLKKMREQLIHFVALLELELDFSEEDVEFANRQELIALIDEIVLQIKPLIASFQYGNALKTGIPIAIVGKPNAGKSTLLNTLLNEERAIVSSIAGTTRDTIEEKLNLNGVDFRFIDTAGIRESVDEIEVIGIEKSKKAIEQSQLTLYLSDFSTMKAEDVIEDVKQLNLEPEKTILVCNKIDLSSERTTEHITNYKAVLQNFGFHNLVFISAKKNDGIDNLKDFLSNYVEKLKLNLGNTIVVNQRHWNELKDTQKALCTGKESLQSGISGELIAFHLRNALKHLGNITGEIDIDKDILGTIFGKFCIGK